MKNIVIIQLLTLLSCIQLKEGSDENRCLKWDKNGDCICCKSKYRGQTCTTICPHCLSRLSQEQSCTYYCKTGYYGKTCDNACPAKCGDGIKGPRLCEEKNGSPHCTTCISGYYGKECDKLCDKSCLDRICDQTGGKCLNCISNMHHGDNCKDKCNRGCVSETCNRTGHCIEGCKYGFFGGKCDSECGKNCIGGKCTGHEYHTYECTKGCLSGHKGIQCLEKCQHPCMECDQHSGDCTSCVEDYVINPKIKKCMKKESPVIIAVSLICVYIVVFVIIVILIVWKIKQNNMRRTRQEQVPEFDQPDASGTALLSHINEGEIIYRRCDTNRADEHVLKLLHVLSSLEERHGECLSQDEHVLKLLHVLSSLEERHGECLSQDEHLMKFMPVLSSPQERHGECISQEILEAKIKDVQSVFVQTNGYKKARETLQQHGYVTITGGLGEGKTTMALMLGMEYRQQGYDIVMVEDIGSFNYQLLLQATYPCFIVLDDVFGLLDFRTEVFDLEKCINFIELLTELVLGNRKKYIVALTSQIHKLKEGLERVRSETTSHFFRGEVRVCLGDGVATLTPDEKMAIFDKHQKNHGTYHNHNKQKMKESKCGFPLFCRMFFAFEPSMTTRQNVFTDPLDFLQTYITALISGKTNISAACIVMFLYEDKLNLPKLEVDTHDKRFESIFEHLKTIILGLTCTDICIAARSLRGTLFTEGDVIGFANPVIYDACGIALASLNIALVLKYCSLKFICEKVRESINGTSGPSNDSHTIQISSAYHEIFVQRLVQGIEDGHYAYVAKHPLIKLGPVKTLLVGRLLGKVKTSNSERGGTVINHDVENILKFSVHGHISSLFDSLFKTDITYLPTTIHTLMNECSICGNSDDLDFILRRYKALITEPMINEAFLLAVKNRHNNISQCLMLHASEVIGEVPAFFEAEVPHEVFYYISIPQMLKPTGLVSVLKLTALSGKHRVFMMLFKLNKLFKEDINGISEDGNTMLHLACDGGSREIVEHILPTFDVNSRGQNRRTPLMKAIYKGAKDIFDLLMANGADHTLTDNHGNTALHLACLGGNTSIVEHLLPSFDINSRGQNGWTPVMTAAYSGKKEGFDFLVENGADLTLTSNYGNTVLHLACSGGNTSIVEHLLPSFDINSRGQSDLTPVMNATYNGKKQVFDLLVTKGADITLTDSFGYNILHQACRGGNIDIVRYVLPLYDINVKGCNNHTPLMRAVCGGDIDVVEFLMSNNADVNLVDDDGDSLLHLACESGNLAMVKRVFQFADINSKDKLGLTPLMIATLNGNLNVFQYLFDGGASLELYDNAGDDVLTLAYRGGCKEIIQQLTQCEEEIQTIEKWTNLMYHVAFGHWIVLEKTRQDSPELVQRDGFGDTLLHLACRGGNLQCVEYLLPSCDINVRGRYGWTPVMMAARCGHLDVCRYLMAHQADLSLVSDTEEDVLSLARRGTNADIETFMLTLPDFSDTE